jgi:hypothetical protein
MPHSCNFTFSRSPVIMTSPRVTGEESDLQVLRVTESTDIGHSVSRGTTDPLPQKRSMLQGVNASEKRWVLGITAKSFRVPQRVKGRDFLTSWVSVLFQKGSHQLHYLNVEDAIFFPIAQQPLVGPGPPHYRDFTITDTPHSVGLLWTSDQPDAETSTWQRTTLTRNRYPCPKRDSKPQSQQARSHWDRLRMQCRTKFHMVQSVSNRCRQGIGKTL